MNQARSPFAESVLSSNFPEHEFYSTGVKAIYGTSIMKSVLATAAEWGLKVSKDSSTTIFNDESRILNSDLIIVAEPEQKAAIIELGYKSKLLSFDEVFEDQDFTPQDPEGFAMDAMTRELGKVAAVSLRAVLDLAGNGHRNPVTAVIPHGVSDLGMALAHAQLERTSRRAIVIDGDINRREKNTLNLITSESNFTIPAVDKHKELLKAFRRGDGLNFLQNLIHDKDK